MAGDRIIVFFFFYTIFFIIIWIEANRHAHTHGKIHKKKLPAVTVFLPFPLQPHRHALHLFYQPWRLNQFTPPLCPWPLAGAAGTQAGQS